MNRMWSWIANVGGRRRAHRERVSWALSEAKALRLKHGAQAETMVEAVLDQPTLPIRRRRFMGLVLKQLRKV